MVEQVGSRTVGTAERAELRAIARAAPVPAPRAEARTEAAPAPASTARVLAASAPVDSERVQRIRRAVEEGRFPISPATIADRLIALRFEFTSGAEGANEPA